MCVYSCCWYRLHRYTCCKSTKYHATATVFSVSLVRQLILPGAHESLCLENPTFGSHIFIFAFKVNSRVPGECGYKSNNETIQLYNFLYNINSIPNIILFIPTVKLIIVK